MKKKLKDQYKEHINFVAADGKTTIMCFKDMIDYLINENWYKNKLEDKNDEAQRIIIKLKAVYNVCTLSGKRYLHAMGIVCSITSQSGTIPLQTSLPKGEKVQSVKEIIKNKGIAVNEYLPPSTTGLSTVKFKEMRELKLNKTLLLDCNMDFFRDSFFFFREHTQPNSSGFMTQYSAGNHPVKSNFFFLAIIDLILSDPSRILTTLEFVIDQAKSLNVETPVIKFDQPLWIKATEIPTAFEDELHGKCRNLDERVWFRRSTDNLLWIKYP